MCFFQRAPGPRVTYQKRRCDQKQCVCVSGVRNGTLWANKLDCYWVGSLDLTFWEINGFPLKTNRKLKATFSSGLNSNQVSAMRHAFPLLFSPWRTAAFRLHRVEGTNLPDFFHPCADLYKKGKLFVLVTPSNPLS